MKEEEIINNHAEYTESDSGSADSLYRLDNNGGQEDDDMLYSLDDDENDDSFDNNDQDDNEAKNGKASLKILFKIMFSPVEGWKELKRKKISPDNFATSLFYPIAGIAAIFKFVTYFYDSSQSLNQLLIGAVTIFISFFFGYFLIIILSNIIMPKSIKDISKRDDGRNFILACLTTLALFYAVGELLPMLEPVLVFLPLWTIYLIFRGIKILKMDVNKEATATVIMSILIIGVPVACGWLFSKIL